MGTSHYYVLRLADYLFRPLERNHFSQKGRRDRDRGWGRGGKRRGGGLSIDRPVHSDTLH